MLENPHNSGLTGRCPRGSAILALLLVLLLGGLGLLRLAPTCELPLLVPIVRTGFQFVGFALETVEVKDFLSVWHGSHWGLVPTAIPRALRKRRLRGFGPLVVARPCSSRTLASAVPLSLVPCKLEECHSICTPRPAARLIVPAWIAPGGCPTCQPAEMRAVSIALASSLASGSGAALIANPWPKYVRISRVIRSRCSGVSVLGVFSFSSARFASAARAFASAVSNRIVSSSRSWIAWSFRDARSTQPETKVSITTPTITNFGPEPFHPSIHSPTATRIPPTTDAISNATITHSQRRLIVIVATLFVLNKIAALVVERWR